MKGGQDEAGQPARHAGAFLLLRNGASKKKKKHGQACGPRVHAPHVPALDARQWRERGAWCELRGLALVTRLRRGLLKCWMAPCCVRACGCEATALPRPLPRLSVSEHAASLTRGHERAKRGATVRTVFFLFGLPRAC